MKRLILSILACLLLAAPALADEPVQLAWMNPAVLGSAAGGSAWFGVTAEGASNATADNKNIYCRALDTPANSGTVSKISIYGSFTGTTNDLKLGLYTDSGGEPSSLVGTETTFNNIGELSLGWHEFDVSYSVVGSTGYWICYINSESGRFRQYYSVPGGTQGYFSSATTFKDAWPASWDTVNDTPSMAEVSIKAYYTW